MWTTPRVAALSMRTNLSRPRYCKFFFAHYASIQHTHSGAHVTTQRRRESNRHQKVLTKSGKQTTSRTAQALTSVTARHLSGHRTIQRMMERSALKRFARFNKQGRRPKFVVKAEMPSRTPGAVSTTETTANSSDLEVTNTPLNVKAKGTKAAMAPTQLTTKAKNLMKNQRKQARVLAVILKRSKSNKK